MRLWRGAENKKAPSRYRASGPGGSMRQGLETLPSSPVRPRHTRGLLYHPISGRYADHCTTGQAFWLTDQGFPGPSRPRGPVVLPGITPRSQRRDRSGFTPDFLFSPLATSSAAGAPRDRIQDKLCDWLHCFEPPTITGLPPGNNPIPSSGPDFWARTAKRPTSSFVLPPWPGSFGRQAASTRLRPPFLAR